MRGKGIVLRVHNQAAKSIDLAFSLLREIIGLRIAALLHSHEDTKMPTLGIIAQEVERDDVARQNENVALECLVQQVECDDSVGSIMVVENGNVVVPVRRSRSCDSVS